MVGIEAKADTRPIYSLSAPELLELPSVGSAKEFDLEGCAALEPDLVILPLKLESAADSLTELGIPVLLINPEDRTLLAETITLVGQATNAVEAADDLLAFTQEQQTRLETPLADADRPDVYLAGNSDLLSTAAAPCTRATSSTWRAAAMWRRTSPTPTGWTSTMSSCWPGTPTTSSWPPTPPTPAMTC